METRKNAVRTFDPITILLVVDERFDDFTANELMYQLVAHVLGLEPNEISYYEGARDFCRQYLKEQVHFFYRPENTIFVNRYVHILNANRNEQKTFWQRIPYISAAIRSVHEFMLDALLFERFGAEIKIAPMESYDEEALYRVMGYCYVRESDIERACEKIFSCILGASA